MVMVIKAAIILFMVTITIELCFLFRPFYWKMFGFFVSGIFIGLTFIAQGTARIYTVIYTILYAMWGLVVPAFRGLVMFASMLTSAVTYTIYSTLYVMWGLVVHAFRGLVMFASMLTSAVTYTIYSTLYAMWGLVVQAFRGLVMLTSEFISSVLRNVSEAPATVTSNHFTTSLAFGVFSFLICVLVGFLCRSGKCDTTDTTPVGRSWIFKTRVTVTTMAQRKVVAIPFHVIISFSIHVFFSSYFEAPVTAMAILFVANISFCIHVFHLEIPWKWRSTKDYSYKPERRKSSTEERVSSLSQFQIGDHIALLRPRYCHVDKEIVYLMDSSSPPKNPEIAKVKRGKCKTDVSSSEQGDMVAKVLDQTGVEFVKTGLRLTATESGQTIVKTGMSKVANEVVTQTVSKGGQTIMTSTIGKIAAKQVLTKTVLNGGQEMVKTSVKVAAAQTVTKSGQELVGVTAKQILGQSVSNGGKEIVKTGARQTTKEFFTHTASKAGKEIVTNGARVTTKKVFTHTASKAGYDIVTKGARHTTKEAFVETTTKTGNELSKSLVGGAVFSTVFEGASALYDIHCARKHVEAGRMNQDDFQKTVKKRVVSGVGNVAGSTVGAAVGQVLLPIPILGGVVGGVVGGVAGRYFGDTAGNVAFEELNEEGEN